MRQPKELCPEWAMEYFVHSKMGVDFTLGNDLIEFINHHNNVLNRHKIAQTIKTKMLRYEVMGNKEGFLGGFKRVLKEWLG